MLYNASSANGLLYYELLGILACVQHTISLLLFSAR